MKFLKRLLSLVLVGAVLVAGLFLDAYLQLRQPMPLDEPRAIDIPSGAGLHQVIAALEAQGLLASARTAYYLKIYAYASGAATRLKAGEYGLVPGMSARAAIDLFVSGKALLHPLRIVEGLTFAELRAELRRSGFLSQTMAGAGDAELMQALGRAGLHPEGRFFPDTYHYPRNTTDLAALRRAADEMERVLNEEWASRAADLPYADAAEALIMASIVEKESALPAEREEIAGVFVNRLRVGMRLQTDPTVIYGMGTAFDGNIRRADLLADTPYNTYTRDGLPPTPICMPGRGAIRAALHPAQTRALYFVARGDGSHEFSETLPQHEAAVRRYQLTPRNAPE